MSEQLIANFVLIFFLFLLTGTGNGKNLKLNNKIISIGCDTSIKLLNICRDNNLECLASNALNLPFKDESIDACIYIAVLHHLVTEERRLESLKNISRLLKKDGECLVYVWAFEQGIYFNQFEINYTKLINILLTFLIRNKR